MGVVFTKTAKGQEEMKARSGNLSPRARRALIFVDGVRTVDDLRGMIVADDLTHTLGMLEEEGYIEVLGISDVGGVSVLPPDAVLPPLTAFRPLPEQPVTAELEMARNFMMNTVKTFTGPYTHLSLIERLFAAKDHASLREEFDAWFRAIVDTRDGRRRAEELREQLLRVI